MSDTEQLLRLLDTLKERQSKSKEAFTTAKSPIAEQEQGRYHALSFAVSKVREIVESDGPECCSVQMDLRRDGRFNAPFVWTCRHCGDKIPVKLGGTAAQSPPGSEHGGDGS